MKTVFVDSYWLAFINREDQHRQAALRAWTALGRARLVTTEEVLVEVFSGLSRASERVRSTAVTVVRALLEDPNVTVLVQSHESFLSGLELYEKRIDKGHSLVDCISMRAKYKRRLRDVLTSDRHFAQERAFGR